MIDIKKAEQEFRNYTSDFDMKESHIERKVRHTFRVEELCEKIAISIGMNEEDINLAKLIGLLHDIGRFKQYTIYSSYADEKTIDHGDFGVEILKKDNYIRKYVETNEYDEIILKAIKNHNKYEIESNLDEKEEMFSKIIRDADKIDIMHEATCEFWKNEEDIINKQQVSTKVMEQFMAKEVVDNKKAKEKIDGVIRTIAFIYDLNFKKSYEIIKENKYIDKIINRFNFENGDTKKQMEEIKKLANEYIDDK